MLTEAHREVLRAVLLSDERPWPGLADISKSRSWVAQVRVRRAKDSKLADLSREARALGFETEEAELAALSEGSAADVAQLVLLTITAATSTITFVSKALKDTSELPENWRKLLNMLRPYRSAAELVPIAQLELVNRWLDAKYGPQKWRYDPDALEAKPVAQTTLLVIHEQVSDTRIVLAVWGQEVHELPTQWLPPTK